MSEIKLMLAPWRPTANLEALRFRAQCLAKIRYFFSQRQVLEVDTPQLAHAGTVDPLLDSLKVKVRHQGESEICWLQTSPEFHMKRLLAAGTGPIYQISHAFRDGEVGVYHNPEFTMLEWYQPHYQLDQLLQECIDLIETVVERPVLLQKNSYRDLCQQFLQLDPFECEEALVYARAAEVRGASVTDWSLIECWDLLFSHAIEPHLGQDNGAGQLCLQAVDDYPAWQAALANVYPDSVDGALVAARFEVYWRGIELANGYSELIDSQEQDKRFLNDQNTRANLNKDFVNKDERLIEALKNDMPTCCGIALGVDRLIMLAGDYTQLSEIMAFPFERA